MPFGGGSGNGGFPDWNNAYVVAALKMVKAATFGSVTAMHGGINVNITTNDKNYSSDQYVARLKCDIKENGYLVYWIYDEIDALTSMGTIYQAFGPLVCNITINSVQLPCWGIIPVSKGDVYRVTQSPGQYNDFKLIFVPCK